MPLLNEKRRVSERLTETFLTGIIGILPLAISLAVMAWVVVFLHDMVGPGSAFGKIMRTAGMTVWTCEVIAYVSGLAGTFLLVYCLGLAIESGAGGQWHRAIDGALQRVPVLGTVYDASKNVTSVFDRRKDSLKGMSPVICYFGEDRNAATPALMPTRDPVRIGDVDYHVVILPTAPVPFGGALLCVRAEWVQPADCGLDDLVGIYISMGVSAPECLGGRSRKPSSDDASSLDVS